MTASTKRPQSPTPQPLGVEVGDFFVAIWGYDQTNVDFYRVVGLTPRGVKVQEWSASVVASQGSSDAVVPGEGPRVRRRYEQGEVVSEEVAPVKTKRLSAGYRGQPSFTVASYASARKWLGGPQHQTASGYGH